jgi:hypothetical protein
MEELMPFTVKILLIGAVIIAALGVTAFSWNPRQQPPTPRAENGSRPVTVGPSRDDPLKADASWKRWPSLSDF